MIVSMNVSHFVEICQVLTSLHELICRGVANFGTRCTVYCHCVLQPSVLVSGFCGVRSTCSVVYVPHAGRTGRNTAVSSVRRQESTVSSWNFFFKVTVVLLVYGGFCHVWDLQYESKNPHPRALVAIFPKRLEIFRPNFTCLLCIPIYSRLWTFIQLSPTMTKLCHIKCDQWPPSVHFGRWWTFWAHYRGRA